MSSLPNAPPTRTAPWKATLLISAGVLLAAAAAAAAIFYTEPSAERTGATKKTAMLVELEAAKLGRFTPRIEALGTVQPALDVVVSSQVAGEILATGPAFIPGGVVEAGDRLLQIERSDYETALTQRRAELRRAEAELAIEQGRQDVAATEYRLVKDSLQSENEALVLRKPQLDIAKSAVQSARAAVRRARLDLARTSVAAPFDGQVLRRDANIGSRVAPGDDLGRLVGTEEYWIMATVPIATLKWIVAAEGSDEPGSRVRVRDPAGWPTDAHREARVLRIIRAVDAQTRLARVLVTVPDPLAREPETEGPPLTLGAIVRLEIDGRPIDNVVRLDRDYVHERDTVWVAQDGTLDIRSVEIVFRDAEYAYVREGIRTGEKIVTTDLATVAEGVPLRTSSSAARRRSNGHPGSDE